MATALILALMPCLLALTALIHYETLRLTGAYLPRLRIRSRQRILFVIAACLTAHLLEVLLYAGVFAVLCQVPAFGSIEGAFGGPLVGGFDDFLYFSLTNYTTLGIGDIYAVGALRLIVGVESLNGLLLIAWSASFCYLNIHADWHPETDDQT